jgi:hypothetical protein
VADQERLDQENNLQSNAGEAALANPQNVKEQAGDLQKLAQDKMREADLVKAEQAKQLAAALEPITNEKKAKKTFFKKLYDFNRPRANLVVGLLF